MLYNTEAIVIRTIPYGETNAIVTLLTPQGTVAAMARGAKKPQSRLSGGVQLCVHGIYTLYQGRGMGTLQQFEIVDAHRMLYQELDLAAYAAYFCELVTSIAEERPNGQEAVFRSFIQTLERLLARREKPSVVARIWEAKVLRFLGASPDWSRCMMCNEGLRGTIRYSPLHGGFICENCYIAIPQRQGQPGKGMREVKSSLPAILQQFSRVPWERIGDVNLGQATQTELRDVLRHQMSDYGGLSLKSRNFVESVDDLE